MARIWGRLNAEGRKRGLWLFAGRLVVVVLIYLAIGRTVSLPQLTLELNATLVYGLVGAILLTLAQAAICTLRWKIVARAVPYLPGFRVSFLAYAEGLFVNQALPSIVGGDAWRVVRWHEHGVSVPDATLSVLLDRIFGLWGAAVLALVCCAMLWQVAYPEYWLGFAAWVMTGIALLCTALLAIVVYGRNPFAVLLTRRWQSLASELMRFRLPGKSSVLCLGMSVAGQVLSGVGVYEIGLALGIDVGFGLLVTLASLIALLSMVPISLAGWGVREAGFVAILTPLQVPAEKAVLLGVFFGLQGLLASLAGGVSLLLGLAAPVERDAGDVL